MYDNPTSEEDRRGEGEPVRSARGEDEEPERQIDRDRKLGREQRGAWQDEWSQDAGVLIPESVLYCLSLSAARLSLLSVASAPSHPFVLPLSLLLSPAVPLSLLSSIPGGIRVSEFRVTPNTPHKTAPGPLHWLFAPARRLSVTAVKSASRLATSNSIRRLETHLRRFVEDRTDPPADEAIDLQPLSVLCTKSHYVCVNNWPVICRVNKTTLPGYLGHLDGRLTCPYIRGNEWKGHCRSIIQSDHL